MSREYYAGKSHTEQNEGVQRSFLANAAERLLGTPNKRGLFKHEDGNDRSLNALPPNTKLLSDKYPRNQ